MNKANEAPASIEGSEILVTGQDIRFKRPMRKNGLIVFPISVEKRVRSEIEKEYNPKIARFCQSSFLDQGFRIEGFKLWGFTDKGLLGPDVINVGKKGKTSSHKGQDITLKGLCFMTLILGIIGKPLLQHPRDFLLDQYKSSLSQFSIL